MGNLDTTNVLLGIMAGVSVLAALFFPDWPSDDYCVLFVKK